MVDNTTNNESASNYAESVVVETSRFSYIWVIPLVAIFIAIWLAYTTISEQGPTITIEFTNAEGIEAGKTKIRYKDVDMGLVERMSLSPDLSRVIVTVRLVNGFEQYLKENTRFWIVKARVHAGEVSGLTTLFSGVYIGIDPVVGGKSSNHFVGLDKPPVVTSDENGRHYILRAQSLGSLDTGSPVYYRQIEVGQVVAYELSEDNQYVDMQVFIRAPFHHLVTTSTRFWDVSGLDLTVDANGLQVNSESVMTLLLGGISFETPVSLEKDIPASDNALFDFYENRNAAQVKRYSNKSYYLLYFNDSVRGLMPGASVEFRGMQIGRVVDIRIEFDADHLEVRIPVLIELEPERFNIIASNEDSRVVSLTDTHDVIDALVDKGLRVQLTTVNVLMGSLVVELDFHEDVPPTQVDMSGQYPVLPTIPNQFDEITTGLAKIIDRINALPLEAIGNDIQKAFANLNGLVSDPELTKTAGLLNDSLTSVKALSGSLNAESVPALNSALVNVVSTLDSAQSLIGPDAPFGRELNNLIVELAEAARAVRLVADYLERHPESMLYGKGDDE